MTAPLPLAVIGGGSIGLRHARLAAGSDALRLTAVVEPNPDRRAELAGLGLPVAASVDAVPPDTSAAIIATPTQGHCADALDALSRGWAVLVEKPVAATLDEADRMIAAAAAAGLPLLVGHHRRCHPFVAIARDRLAHIGDPVAVQGIWALRKHDGYHDAAWRVAQGGGPVLINLIHDMDLLRLLAGEIVQVSAMLSSERRGGPVEDTAAICLRFASGALGTFLLTDAGASPWAFEAATGENPAIAASGRDCWRFIGTRGALSFPSLTLWGDAADAAPDWSRPMRAAPGPALARVDALDEQLHRFARVARGAADDLLATGADGRAVLAVTLAVLKAGAAGRPVTVTP